VLFPSGLLHGLRHRFEAPGKFPVVFPTYLCLTHYPPHYLGDTGWSQTKFLDDDWKYSQVTDSDALHRLHCF
jgi:hypothetical protein